MMSRRRFHTGSVGPTLLPRGPARRSASTATRSSTSARRARPCARTSYGRPRTESPRARAPPLVNCVVAHVATHPVTTYHKLLAVGAAPRRAAGDANLPVGRLGGRRRSRHGWLLVPRRPCRAGGNDARCSACARCPSASNEVPPRAPRPVACQAPAALCYGARRPHGGATGPPVAQGRPQRSVLHDTPVLNFVCDRHKQFFSASD